MSCICIIDTTIFLNLINVPNRNDQKDQVKSDFKTFAESGATFILPMATIIETGNHIAQNGDGGTRRQTAERFCKAVKGAFLGIAPYKPSEFPDKHEVLTWLDQFPDAAGKNVKGDSKDEGTSFGDFSIIAEYHKAVTLTHGMVEVFIWSLDSDLQQYRHPKSPRT